MKWLWRPIANHPVRFGVVLTILGLILTAAANFTGLSDFYRSARGTNFTYVITASRRDLRIGNRADLSLSKLYTTNTSQTVVPVDNLECAWSFEPHPRTAAAGSACQGATVIASRSDFAPGAPGTMDVTVSVTTHDIGKKADPAGAPAATLQLHFIDTFDPDVTVEPGTVAAGRTADARVKFPLDGTPGSIRCRWSADGVSVTAEKMFADPDACETAVTAPRDAMGALKLGVSIFTEAGFPPIARSVTLDVERPPSRYMLLVLDYGARMAAGWVGARTAFVDMQDAAARALTYMDDTTGGFAGITAFGGVPTSAIAPVPAGAPPGPECANVRSLYPFGALVRNDAVAALSTLVPSGRAAPLANAILQAYREYVPFREADRDRPRDRFFLIVLTGGGDTCGARDLVGMLRDTMSQADLPGLFLANKILEIVVAMPRLEDGEILDRLIHGPANQSGEQRPVIIKAENSEMLNHTLDALGRMAGRSGAQAAAGCKDLIAILDRIQGDKRAVTVVQGFCNGLA